MDELGSIWRNQESINDLKQKLLYKTLELDNVRIQANEQMIKNEEKVHQLIQHLKTVYKERDEARDQVKKLLAKFSTFIPQNGIINSPIQIQPSKANSNITESNSQSDTYNYQSPNDPFFDIVSSPDSSNLGYLNQQKKKPFIVDQGCLVIDALAKGKPLPQKGKLCQAIQEAGPLLETLMVAGQLPNWRNPPPLQWSQIPPVGIVNLGKTNNIFPNVFSFPEMGYGTSQMFSSGPVMKFDGESFFGGVNGSDCGKLRKRHRLQ